MTIQVRYTLQDGTVTGWLDYSTDYGGIITIDTNVSKAVEWRPKPKPKPKPCAAMSPFTVDGVRVRCELTHPDPSPSPVYHTCEHAVTVDGAYYTGLTELSWHEPEEGEAR